jgi:hypothetical protein
MNSMSEPRLSERLTLRDVSDCMAVGYEDALDEVFAFLNESSLEQLPCGDGVVQRNTFKAFLAKRLRDELAERLGLSQKARRKYGIE